MKSFCVFLILLLFSFTGCTHVISDESLRLVDNSISFAMLKESPDKYIGRYLLLGGAVASVSNTKQGGQLEVVQLKLSCDNMPDTLSISGGRFLAQTTGFLDPFIYAANQLVTIVGEVKGHKSMELGQIDYDYPVIAIKELYLWRKADIRYYPYPYFYPDIYLYYYHHVYPYYFYGYGWP